MSTLENWLNRRKGKRADLFKLDTTNKTPEENIIEILQGLYVKKSYQNDISPTNKNSSSEFRTMSGFRNMQKNGSDNRKLAYLNALVTLLCKEDRINWGFTAEELMTCIRVSLVDESVFIRSAALRVLRYLIKIEEDVVTFNNLKLPYLITRSIDLMLRNEGERAQALRVVRRVIGVIGAAGYPSRRHRAAYVDQGILRCLAAITRSGGAGDGTGDRLSRPAIATLAEICVLNPDLFISCGGVSAVIRQLSECATPRMAEALCGVLLHTLNEPASRRSARIDLTCLSFPYCDFHIRSAGTDAKKDEREMRFTCSRLALVCVLRSWPGLLHFCQPAARAGLRALVAALHLPRLDVRKAILDLLYELVGLPQPEWTDEISVALDAVDPSDFQDSWRLNEGFVAAEGTAILPHLNATGLDITEVHLALLLQCFLEAGLLDGLAEVIVTSDTFISVRATVLLGQLLHLIHILVPAQICSITPALPSLISQASAGKPQALAAVAALRRLHSMLEARPATNSLFLDHIVQYCSGTFKEKAEDVTKCRKEKDNANMAKPKPMPDTGLYKNNSIEFLNESDNENEPKQRHSIGSRADVANRNVGVLVKSKSVSSRTSAAVSKVTKSPLFFNLFERDSDSLIRCTSVQNKDVNTWNWEIIRTILKENDSAPLLNLNDSAHKAWVARIINYLKPSSNKYSHTDLSTTCQGHSATRAGCQLIRHLLRHNDLDSQRLLEELFLDVSHQIEAIETGRKAHECLFSPQHMSNTMCQMYFLFIGQLCHSHTGLRLFKQTKLYENLLELSTKTHHSCYVKLVISSLDYTIDSYPRDILAKTLTCNIQASRLYTTQFLNVLLRASQKSRDILRRKSKMKKNLLQEHLKSHKEDSDDVNGTDMDTWLLQMLVGQVKDDFKAVVKCALGILEEAISVPAFSDKLVVMKDTLSQNCRLDKSADPASLDFSVVGDRGYLLWLTLEVTAIAYNDVKSISFIKKHLDFWTKCYNYRYARLVEGGVHEALTAGAGARAAVRPRRSARPPPHLHAALAAGAARALLTSALTAHYKILQRKKCSNEREIADLKASLWAVGNTAVTAQGLQLLMNLSNGYLEDSVPVHVVRLAKYSPVYSVRATAFYVLALIGGTYDGANLLTDLGWLSVRHTRHERFPVIHDDIYFPTDESVSGEVHRFIASPDRRYQIHAYDTEVSEHSDLADHSMAESLYSENVRPYNKQQSSTAEQPPELKDRDVVDYKTNSTTEVRREDKRKSHTLPSQGCSSSHDRPVLSESRTVDILRDFSNYERTGPVRVPMAENRLLIGRMNSLEHAHEGRVRNTSESSTSGVSSCDSFLGKYPIPDRVLTLSPIPSSSSLYGMKSSSSSQRPKLAETQRRTSTSSFTAPEVASSPPTQLDMSGYATLKSLNRHRRPHLSESAASGSSDVDDLSWILLDSTRRSKPFSSLRDKAKTTRERMTKLSLLEYDWKPLLLAEGAEDGSTRPSPPPLARAPPAPLCTRPPTYMAVCLPKHLNDLFPSEEEYQQSEKGGENKIDHPRRNRVSSFLADSSNASTENRSRATPDSQKMSTHRGGEVIGAFTNSVFNRGTVSAIANSTAVGHVSGSASTNAAINTILTATMVTTNAIVEINNTGPIAPIVNVITAPNSEDTIRTVAINDNTDTSEASTSASKTANESIGASQTKEIVVKTETSRQIVQMRSNAAETSAVVNGFEVKTFGSASRLIGTMRNNTGKASANVSGGSNASIVSGGAGGEGRTCRWRHAAADCLACVRTRPPSSHELREAFFADLESPGASGERRSPPPTEPSAPRAELLHHVLFMANPIHLRQTRSALLSLKQRYPELFRSACVYSEVCAMLARDTYMVCARRFLQELFLDTVFDCFLAEPATVLARHLPPTPLHAKH